MPKRQLPLPNLRASKRLLLRKKRNFLRFSTIFGEKIGVFLNIQCYDQNLALFSFVMSQKRQFFADFFGDNIFKNHNIGPLSNLSRCG
jgi:hypothetical protein